MWGPYWFREGGNLAIFEVVEIMCRFEFEICVSGDPLGFESVERLAIF